MNITDMTPKKYAAEQAKRILRTNPNTTAHEHRPAAAKLSERARQIMSIPEREPGKYAMPKPPGAAGAREYTVGTGTYTGEELRPFAGRAGAMRAFNLPSRGME